MAGRRLFWDLVSLAVVAFMVGAAVALLRHGVFTVVPSLPDRMPSMVTHVHAHLV